MDFEEIDTVLGDTLGKGDIVWDGGFHQILRVQDEDDDKIIFDTYNLSTGDEDSLTIYPGLYSTIYRSY